MSTTVQRAEKLFIQYLRENNLKVTRERLALLNEIFSTKEHLDADDLLARMRANKKKASRATVYRTLDLLVQCGLVRKSRLGQEHYFYEKVEPGKRHDHMVCTHCGKVVEFWDPDIDERQRQICLEHGFRPSFYSIQIRGLCSDCQKLEHESTFLETH